ncbi:hypothetical protein H4R34_000785 [Dimargaris verticillata]|uniref:Branchpoint-bridging protein n=1 Tax=Dimargaris verticillata TaxID=2761393 RepID=A0A9W8BB38_9FUNG|nr:hypothetical protein H4R34_000785 [Dimargaris verticillata]
MNSLPASIAEALNRAASQVAKAAQIPSQPLVTTVPDASYLPPIADQDETPKRRRKTRWGEPAPAPMATATSHPVTAQLARDDLELYALNVRIEDLGRKLRQGDYVPPEHERSPSPEPVYNAEGKRVNTREVRYRKRIEDERHQLVRKAQALNSQYEPPADYRPPKRFHKKVFIPAKEYPEVNFIGLLIGPRGHTLKKMESTSGARISIRGKGSVKEGRNTDTGSTPGADEDLHCLISAAEESKVTHATELVLEVIQSSATTPEQQNQLKQNQLRELAALNGTLRSTENMVCNNCGVLGHAKWDCPEPPNITNNIRCHNCNGVGHTARDCRSRPLRSDHSPESDAVALPKPPTASNASAPGGGRMPPLSPGGYESPRDHPYRDYRDNRGRGRGRGWGRGRGRGRGRHYGPGSGDPLHASGYPPEPYMGAAPYLPEAPPMAPYPSYPGYPPASSTDPMAQPWGAMPYPYYYGGYPYYPPAAGWPAPSTGAPPPPPSDGIPPPPPTESAPPPPASPPPPPPPPGGPTA